MGKERETPHFWDEKSGNHRFLGKNGKFGDVEMKNGGIPNLEMANTPNDA